MPVFVIFVLIFKFIYVDDGFNLLMHICIPVFAGLFIAIALNPVLIFIQTKLKIKSRGIAIVLTFLLFIFVLVLLFIMVVPGIMQSLTEFVKDIPNLIKVINDYVIEIGDTMIEGGSSELYIKLEETIISYTQKLYEIASSLLNKVIISTISILSALWNFLISIFISIYILYDKEHFENLFNRICHSLFEKKHADEILKLGYNLYYNVTSFISGKLLDSLIIGVIAYVGAKYLINAPYSLIIGVLIGLTNMIPYFGPFIGGIPATIITLLYNPTKGLWMALFVLVLQQFDGWFLGPKILGIKLELRPVWIIIAIIIGGGLFGPIGMFLATPFAALIKTFLEGYMTLKLKDKEITLPHVNK